jgi:protein-tyrosine phosphatase
MLQRCSKPVNCAKRILAPSNMFDHRRLEFQGAVNFRDLGGYPTGRGRRMRWGRLYRSDSLADLTPLDLERLGQLNLRTLIDFRTAAERAIKPNRLPAGTSTRTVEIPFVPRGVPEMFRDILAGAIDAEGIERQVLGHYRRFPVDHSSEYCRMLDLIGRKENLPLLVHCTSGKDRTGFAAAIILLAVGASRQVVLEDYALTNLYRRQIQYLIGPATPASLMAMLTSAQPKYLEAAFEVIDRTYGSTDAYLERALLLDDVARGRLAALLTEPDPRLDGDPQRRGG